MRITVRPFGALREAAGVAHPGEPVALQLADGARVADVAAALGLPPGWIHSVLIDGERGAADDVLGDGMELTLMPPFGGGEPREGSK